MLRNSVILLLAVIGAPAVPIVAQVTKPLPTAYRLPKPTSFAASQQPDGTILVVWSAVPEAASYKLVRSAPPAPMAGVSLANPSDTQYVDTDVKAGSTYYYQVSAVNEAGSEGLRAGTAPVTVSGASQTLAAGGDPDADPGSGGDAQAPVSPPTNVVAKPYPYKTPTVFWESSVSGATFIVERLDPMVYTSEIAKSAWQKIPGPGLEGSWPCCKMIDRSPPPFGYLRYRVTAMEPSTRRSVPVEAGIGISNNMIKTDQYLYADGFAVGEKRQVAGAPGGYNVWVSLDTTIALVWGNGVVTARSRGITYLMGSTKMDGGVRSFIYRIFVE